MLNLSESNSQSPTLRGVLRDVRSMPPAERLLFVKTALCPWQSTKDNVIMWAKIIGTFLVLIVAGVGLNSHLVYGPTEVFSAFIGRIFLSVLIGYTTVSYMIIELGKGLRDTIQHERRKHVKEMEAAIDALGKQLLGRLQESSGRTDINANPISMAAAALDAADVSRTRRKTDNPLRLALDGTLRPEDIAPDPIDDDEEKF